jgi:hypothetical protein
VLSVVSGTIGEEVVIGLDIFRQINDFPFLQLPNAVQYDRFSIVIGVLIVTVQTDPADIFSTIGFICIGDFILNEDSLKGAFRDTSSAVDANIWIYVHPGPLLNGLTWNDTVYRADFNTASVP